MRRIAQNGAAEVWEAYDEVLARRVALKLLTVGSAADPATQEHFHRAAVATARLSHHHIVATFDTGQDAGSAFFVMELVEAPTLAEILAHEGALRPRLAAMICAQVADALSAAHRAGILHGDLRPANVFVREGLDGAPNVKVADFGLAPVSGAGRYQAPEVLAGAEPDARSDVYSLGVVLYEVLVGRPPFEIDGGPAHASAETQPVPVPVRPRQLRAGIPRTLEAVTLKALAVAPGERFSTAAEMRIALLAVDLQADDALPVHAHDPTPPAGMPATSVQPERRWLVPAVATVLLAAAVVLLGLVLSRSDLARDLLGRDDRPAVAAPGPSAALAIQAITAFDPDGDGSENDARLGNAIDGDPATSWATSRYNTRDFGKLKPGVGVWVDLGTRAKPGSIRVASPSVGWSANVHVSGEPGSTLAAWGPVAASVAEADGTVEVRLPGNEGRYVLVWFTSTGTDNRVEVTELTVA